MIVKKLDQKINFGAYVKSPIHVEIKTDFVLKLETIESFVTFSSQISTSPNLKAMVLPSCNISFSFPSSIKNLSRFMRRNSRYTPKT